MIASRALHDQDVDLLLRKDRRFHNRLIVEIDVACVKDRAAFGAQENSGGAEDVPCIEELECQPLCSVPWRTFGGDRDALPQRTPMPEICRVIGFAMCEKWI